MQSLPLLNDIGVAGKYRGDFDEAASADRRAFGIVNECGSDQLELRASLLHNIAGLAHARGEGMAAESTAREGIALRLASAATTPLDLATDRAALAAILVDLGQSVEARELLTDVLAVFEQTYGPEHYEVAVTLHNLGSLEHRSGDFEAATEALTRAVQIKRLALDRDHPDLAISLHNLACAQSALGLADQATESFREAITLLTGAVASDHPTLASCRDRLSRMSTDRQPSSQRTSSDLPSTPEGVDGRSTERR
ncbi:tetratricopeptide repeat protein [Kribbella catacumbae]|uniref:tetratricopeptide repeat protein n=1 Tax=Kribbella catacumbae TaxID=460086 RepID=UPI0003718948|nr:tetratricopeptide repeat protein [Kribbella catacumbae]